jgi:CheY-like chemotaxis protein
LWVVHGIVKGHQGAITVESELGRGTTVTVYLPAPEAESPEERPAEVAPRITGTVPGGEHVLFVDDEEAMVFLAGRALERHGYRVTGYSDPTLALHDFRARPREFGLVVTDVTMPGLSGAELVRELRRIRPEVPIVMTSGFLRPEDVEAARALGIDELLLKPSSVEQWGQILHRSIRARREES